MSEWRTNRRTRAKFHLRNPAELNEVLRSELATIGREDRVEQLGAALQNQISKAYADYEANRGAHNVDLNEASEQIWQQIQGSGPSGLRSAIKDEPGMGRAKYVWRMLRFHTGADVHMPVTADWQLTSDIDKEVGWDYRRDGWDHPLREVAYAERAREQKRLDAIVEYISATQYPVDQFRAAMRWRGLLY